MTDKLEYYCHNCREYRTAYCGTDIEIGLEPTQTWPNDQTVCILQQAYVLQRSRKRTIDINHEKKASSN